MNRKRTRIDRAIDNLVRAAIVLAAIYCLATIGWVAASI